MHNLETVSSFIILLIYANKNHKSNEIFIIFLNPTHCRGMKQTFLSNSIGNY